MFTACPVHATVGRYAEPAPSLSDEMSGGWYGPTQTEIDGSVATYIRRSAFDQENEHQEQAITAWLENHGLTLGEVDVLSETASGASRSRDEFQRLLSKIEAGDVDHVVVWELSRIAQEGELAQRFFNTCEDHDVHVPITSGSIREIKPDRTNRFVADILAAVYAEERRTLIQRTKLGQERALEHGRWIRPAAARIHGRR